MLLDEQSSSEQIAIFRKMTPEQRWRAAHQLYWHYGYNPNVARLLIGRKNG